MKFECALRVPIHAMLALAGAWFLAAAGGNASETLEPPPVDVSETLASIFAEARIPGGAAIVLRGDRIIAQGVTGVRKRGAEDLITLGDRFHLGSCTKAMTATLAGLLVDEGKLRWTTTLGEVFGDTVKDFHPRWRSVTLQQVLAHRAGLPANPGRALATRLARSAAAIDRQRAALAAEILLKPPETKPGTRYVYSNVGYALVGAVMEKITGRTWEDLMRERLFQPLGITTGGFGAPGTLDELDQPRGHLSSGEPVEPGRRADNLPAIGPAATAHMAMGDWAKFAALHLRGDPANPQRHVALLKPETFAELHRPAADELYVGGWRIVNRWWARGSRAGDNGLALSHAGSNTRWFCVVELAPEIDFAVLVAVNAADDAVRPACIKAVDAMATLFARRRDGAR